MGASFLESNFEAGGKGFEDYRPSLYPPLSLSPPPSLSPFPSHRHFLPSCVVKQAARFLPI